MGQLPVVSRAWTCSRTKPQAVEHVNIPKKGLSMSTCRIQGWGTPRSSNGMAEELFYQPDFPLHQPPGHSSSIPHGALGVTVGWGGLVPLSGPPGPRLLMAPNSAHAGAENQRPWFDGLEVFRCWQSLQPPISITGV